MRYVIFDLDGTLSDDRHRLHYLQQSPPNFEEYHATCDFDGVMNLDVFEREVAVNDGIIFITSRPEKWRAVTERWIAENLPVKDYKLLMRPDGDVRTSPDLKSALYSSINEVADIIYDDRHDVLEEFAAVHCMETCHLTYQGEPNPPVPTHRQLAGIPPVEPHEVLRVMASTYEERNAVYGDNYRMVGPIMKILFPDGASAELLGSDSFHLFELLVVKLSRFAISGLKHQDSIHDAGVYCAMIASIVEKQK